MKKSLRSQDKSIYLAFALSPTIVFQSLYDLEQSSDRSFHFQLFKGTQPIQKTTSFTTEAMKRSSQMYLYFSLPQYAQKLHQAYSIRLIEETDVEERVMYESLIDLNQYIHEHNTQERDFWTEILKHSTETYKLTIMQRVFLKRTRFELDDIINSSQMGQELDVVDIPQIQMKTSKIGIRKSKSYSSSSSLNSLISPRRLDTISEEDSTVPLTDRKERDSIGESKHRPQRMSASVKKSEVMDFEGELKKNSTWVQKNNLFDEQFFNAFDNNNQQGYHHKKHQKENPTHHPQHDHIKPKPFIQNQFSQPGSKISKNTKDSQKQTDDNSISFLQKSSLLMDMSHSQLSISPDDQVCFKLKWIVLVVVILVLAVLASLSTDAFNITEGKGRKRGKVEKRKGDKERGRGKEGKVNKERNKEHV